MVIVADRFDEDVGAKPSICARFDARLRFPGDPTDLLLFYNDAYIPLIGDRHPAALGRPILEAFPEIKEIYGPMAKRVLDGDSIVLENQRYRHTRHGILEDLWFNLSYSPVHDEDGTVAGILAIGLNTTPQVLAEQAKSEAEGRLRRVLERSRKKSALYQGTTLSRAINVENTLGFSP